MADEIRNLPTDDAIKNTPQELNTLSRYFEQSGSGQSLVNEVKDVGIAAIIFLLIVNPLTDWLLNYVPHMGSPLIRMVARVIFFSIAFYVVLLMIKR